MAFSTSTWFLCRECYANMRMEQQERDEEIENVENVGRAAGEGGRGKKFDI